MGSCKNWFSSDWISKCQKQSTNAQIKTLSLSQDEQNKIQGQTYRIVKKPNSSVGILYIDNVFYYEGQISQGKAKGKGLAKWVISPYSQAVYKGQFSFNKRHGKGCYKQQNNLSFDGTWKNNFPSEGTLKYNGGKHQILSLFTQNEDKLEDGSIEIVFEDKTQYEGRFARSQQDGKYYFEQKGKINFPDGSSYDGKWKKGLFDGKGVYIWRNGLKYRGEYRAGIKQGKGELFLPDKDLFIKGRWVNDKKEGLFELKRKASNVPNGIFIKDIKFKDDKLIN